VYTGGTGAWVAGSAGTLWRVEAGDAVPIVTGIDSDVDLTGVWGRGDGSDVDLVMVGTSGLIVEYDGSDFSQTDLGTATFQDVDGSAGNLTAVGWGGVYDQEGADWVFQSLPGSFRLASIAVFGDDAIAVGDGGAVLRRTGGVWEQIEQTVVTKDLHAVSATSTSDAWIVGEDGVVLHLEGSTFTEIESGLATTLWGVWLADDGGVWVVGNNGVAIRRKDAGTTFESLPTGVDANLYAVYGAGDQVWAVGNRGQVLKYAPP
jgi:hypothetical protein